MRIQPKADSPRLQRGQREDPRVERAVRHTATKFNVSRSWVRHTILADYFGIDIVHYDEAVEKRKKLKVVRRRASG